MGHHVVDPNGTRPARRRPSAERAINDEVGLAGSGRAGFPRYEP